MVTHPSDISWKGRLHLLRESVLRPSFCDASSLKTVEVTMNSVQTWLASKCKVWVAARNGMAGGVDSGCARESRK